MTERFILLSVFFLCSLHLGYGLSYSGHKVFRVVPQQKEKLEWLLRLPDAGIQVKFWETPKFLGQSVNIQVAPEHVNAVQTALVDLRIEHKLIIDDLQKLIDNQSAQHALMRSKYSKDNFVEWNYDRYLNLSEAYTWLNEKAAACGSARCSQFDIGTTYEGRRIALLKITDGSGSPKPTSLWIDGGIHAREWISPAVAEYFIDRLINDYGVDAEVTAILNRYDVYILPILNADGYEYTWTTDRLWRKSRQPWGLCTGTDINRNFDFHWMETGASSNPCAETYAGPQPYSEPEALAVAEYVRNTSKIDWTLFLTLHSYSQLWMLPYGYTCTRIPTYDELLRVSTAGVAALEAVYGTNYQTGGACEILYDSAGTSRDWAYGVPLIPYVYTIELRDTGEYGFVLPPELILPTVVETWAGFKAMMAAIP